MIYFQEKALLDVVSEKEILQQHSEVLKVRLDEQTQMIANLHKDVHDTRNTVTTQEKKLADNKVLFILNELLSTDCQIVLQL